MDKVFDVTCEGTSLARAVAQADQRAAEYFGVNPGAIGTLIAREVTRPRAAKRQFASDHLPWRIDVRYVDLR